MEINRDDLSKLIPGSFLTCGIYVSLWIPTANREEQIKSELDTLFGVSLDNNSNVDTQCRILNEIESLLNFLNEFCWQCPKNCQEEFSSLIDSPGKAVMVIRIERPLVNEESLKFKQELSFDFLPNGIEGCNLRDIFKNNIQMLKYLACQWCPTKCSQKIIFVDFTPKFTGDNEE